MLKLQPLNSTIYGSAYFDLKTKKLAQYIPEGSIAIIKHKDIDEMGAASLIQKKVKAVINLLPSMSGEYPSVGTWKLIESGTRVFDMDQAIFCATDFSQGDLFAIHDQHLFSMSRGMNSQIAPLFEYTKATVQFKQKLAEAKMVKQLKAFTQNTLHHAQNEMNEILKPIPLPQLVTNIQGRHVVIVTRGQGYIEDLKAIRHYVQERKPLFIGVDGGADAILECGYTPDIIFGDMDSVSAEALHSGAEIIVHAYPNGYGPGLKELSKHGLYGKTFSCFGTSEDAAHLLAYEAGAKLIVTLGSHTTMLDFLEKGRQGMGSTLLVRLKIGDKLVDAKGIRLLFPKE